MNLNTFEIAQNIKSKQFSKVETAINFFITEAAINNGGLAIPTLNDPLSNKTVNIEEVHYTFCNQFTTIINELFSSPSYKPSNETINVFVKYKFVIEWIFSASIWNNTDALIDHLGLIKHDSVGNIKLNKRNTPRLLMLITISSKHKLPWLELFKLGGLTAYLAYTCLLSQPVPALSKASNLGFNYLLESGKDLPIFNLPLVGDLGTVNYPFFSCSYATSPAKYEFKKWLTSLIRHNLPQWLSEETKQHINKIKKFQVKKKMKLGIMLEQFSKNHAMYRCFKSALQGMAGNYELIAFADQKDIDNSDFSVFDKTVAFKELFDISTNAKLVCQENVDILLYPSIGMKFWGIYLSQLRLSPLQVMMGGHPSSSFSPEIDYFLIPIKLPTTSDLEPYHSEKIITAKKSWRELNAHIMHSELTQSFIDEHNHFLYDDDVIHIAINGVITKVSYSVIDICQKIEARLKNKVCFTFFTTYSTNQLGYLSTKKQLKKSLKDIELTPYNDYLNYMKVISKCHLLLPTLPFGGSNSNIDAMVLRKPKLFIKGKAQIYTKADLWEWERVDLVDELGCDNESELVDKAVQLAEDQALRKSLYNSMVTKCTLKNIFKPKDTVNEAIPHLLSQLILKEELEA